VGRKIGDGGVAVTPRNHRSGISFLFAAVLTAAMAGIALAQNSQPPAAAAPKVSAPPAAPAGAPAALPAMPPQPPPVTPLAAPPADKRGFLNNIGQWWDQSIADFKAKMKDQQTKLDDFNKQSADAAKDAATATGEAMKNAADAMTHFSHVIEIQEICQVAGNGSADCATAATNACKGKGYNAGQPLDVRTAEKCNASLWVSGGSPAATDCPVETTLLRAACQ
jgi:hypothetical protein